MNNRKCEHGLVTMGDVTKCPTCHIKDLQHKNVNLGLKLQREKEAYNRLADYAQDLRHGYDEVIAYIEKPFLTLMTDEIIARVEPRLLAFDDAVYRFTKAKFEAILKQYSRVKQVIVKYYSSKT
jgi:hypothetical protein